MSFMDKVRGEKALPKNSAADISLRGLEKIHRFIADGIYIQECKVDFSRKQMTSSKTLKKV